MYILKFKDQECWIAPWDGDPGRTLVKDNAKLFKTSDSASKFSKKIIAKNCQRPFDLIIELN